MPTLRDSYRVVKWASLKGCAPIMSVSAEKVLRQAMQLSSLDRAALVEGLIASLDKPDPALDALWLKEAEDRIAAYQAGELAAIDVEEAFAELER